MFSHIRAHLLLTVLTLVLGSVLYPLTLLAVGRTLMPGSASGSLIVDSQGTVRGSRLIAQEFKGDEWFQPRPSAVNFNAAGSGGSNFGANNPKLRERVAKQLEGTPHGQTVPADAITTSASGLDTYISLANARSQVERVAKARSLAVADVQQLVEKLAYRPLVGLAGGEPIVNVVELNMHLARP